MLSKRRFSPKPTIQVQGLVHTRGMSYEKRDMGEVVRHRRQAREDDLRVYVASLLENAKDPELAHSAYAAFLAIANDRHEEELSPGLIGALRAFTNRTQRRIRRIQRDNEIGARVERMRRDHGLSIKPPASCRVDNRRENAHHVVASIAHMSAETVYKKWLKYTSSEDAGPDRRFDP
jgi:hypothetical protein